MLYQIEKRALPITTNVFHGLSPLPHIHTHLELIWMAEGASCANVDNKEFLMEQGDLFLAFPNQIHFYQDTTSLQGYLFIFSQDLFPDLKELFQNKVPASPIIKNSCLPKDTEKRLKKIMKKNNSDSTFDRIAAKGYLLALMGELLPLMSLIPAPSDHDSIKSVLTYCSENYTEPLSLEIISRNLHLNKYYISHIFKERMNIGFTDFVNSLRVEHACNLLERGCSITEIAFSSGFSSIRTFNRVFANTVGMTPREYLKRKI